MHPPLRIAILECDTPLGQTRATYGSYGGVFRALLSAGADALDQPDLISSSKGLDLTFWDVLHAQSYPKLEDIDAVLMTGSRHNSFDNDPWIVKLVQFTREVLAQNRVRLIGVCFGHQIIGRALGVKVARSESGWELSVSHVKMTETGKRLFGKDVLSLHQMHLDKVYEYPNEVEELGSSPVCKVQGMYAKGRLITVQGHPEFNATIIEEILAARNANKLFSDEAYKDAMDRVRRQHDGVLVAQGFLKFLLED